MNHRDLSTYYTQIKAQLDEKLTEVETLRARVESLKSSADADVGSIETVLETAQTTLTSIQETADQLTVDLTKIDALRTKANDPDDGLEVTIDEIDTLKTQANELKNDIKAFRDTSQDNNSQIEAFQKQSSKIVGSLTKIEDNAKISLEQIEKYYKLATDTGLAGSFDKRKDDLKSSVSRWFWTMVISSGILSAILVAVLFITLKDNLNLGYAFSFRVVFISPLLFFVLFSAYQYSKERDLLERYAFKAVTALALESYTELLTFRFKDTKHETQILSFVLSAMQTIYKEPHDSKAKPTVKLRTGTKQGAATAEASTT